MKTQFINIDEQCKIQAVGEILKSRRRELKLSKAEVARRAGIAPNYVAKIEQGTSGFTVQNLFRMLNALGMVTLFRPTEELKIAG